MNSVETLTILDAKKCATKRGNGVNLVLDFDMRGRVIHDWILWSHPNDHAVRRHRVRYRQLGDACGTYALDALVGRQCQALIKHRLFSNGNIYHQIKEYIYDYD